MIFSVLVLLIGLASLIMWRALPIPFLAFIGYTLVIVYIIMWIINQWDKRESKLDRLSMIFTLFGMLSNGIVIMANGGYMPTLGNISHGVWMSINDKYAVLLPLGDVLTLYVDYIPIHYSIGDVFLFLGFVFSIIFWTYAKIRPSVLD